ncbi:hypothetical protein QBC45DRAFT_412755 [Copromyces sp. CBS 386.78]|nr:hypothetical protein QBC45DRAFT_412755 [Copromyces sp. CBS 386.78]
MPPQQHGQQQHPQEQQKQVHHDSRIMLLACDQCFGETSRKCNRQYPCCYRCERKKEVCTYTNKVFTACKLCMESGVELDCDRTVPRCSNCQAQGQSYCDYYMEVLSYTKKCSQCNIRKKECLPGENSGPCRYCEESNLPCSYRRANAPKK